MKTLALLFLAIANPAHAQLYSTLTYGAAGVHHPCQPISHEERMIYIRSGGAVPAVDHMCQNVPFSWSSTVSGLAWQGVLPVPAEPYIHSIRSAGPLHENASFAARCTSAIVEGASVFHGCDLSAATAPGAGYGIPSITSTITVSDTLNGPPGSGGLWAASYSTGMNVAADAAVALVSDPAWISGGVVVLYEVADSAWTLSASLTTSAQSEGISSIAVPFRFSAQRLGAESCSTLRQRASLSQPVTTDSFIPWRCAPWVGFAELDLGAENSEYTMELRLMARVAGLKMLQTEVPQVRGEGGWGDRTGEIQQALTEHEDSWRRSQLGRAFMERLVHAR